MKIVVFASSEDSVRSLIAATFFDAFTLPTLIRARPLAARAQGTPPEVTEAMQEVGLVAPPQPQVLSPGALAGATLTIRFGDLRLPSDLPGERWDVMLPGGASVEQVRPIRDAIRRRVWRLVALHGWYRLQPAQAIRAQRAGNA